MQVLQSRINTESILDRKFYSSYALGKIYQLEDIALNLIDVASRRGKSSLESKYRQLHGELKLMERQLHNPSDMNRADLKLSKIFREARSDYKEMMGTGTKEQRSDTNEQRFDTGELHEPVPFVESPTSTELAVGVA